MKKFTLFLYGCVLMLLLTAHNADAQTPVAKNGQLQVIGLKLCNQYGNPIQLRGMSTHGIQWFENCITDASLDALANDWEADILRISLYVQEDGYDNDPAGFTQKVSNIIDKVTARGMYALVDWHQLTPGDPNVNLAKAKTFFTAIANAHKNKNNILYDICNEPNGNSVTWPVIKNYANQLIPVIRAIDPDAPILVGTHGWASLGVSMGGSAQDVVGNQLSFSNIMYTFHFYAASHGSSYLNELSWAADRIPMFVTEFGTQEASGDGGNNFTMSQQYIDLMRNKKISWCNWNYSDDGRSGAVWKAGTCGNGPWTVANLKPAGVWIRERMKSPADDFPGGTPNPGCVPVSASGDDGNVAANVLDNNLATRWSASGDGQWIQFCLGDTVAVSGVQIAFYNGNVRTSTFDVLVGNNGSTWTTAASGRVSSGTSTALETFTFTPVSGKYVRIVGHGNSVNLWNSYTEVKIQTSTGGGGQTFTLTPEADAYVRDGTNAAITHGTTDPTLLITKVSPGAQLNNARESYLRFDLATVSGTVSSATLRVYGKVDLTTVPSVPIGIYSVANTTWSESALTWNNKPASGGGLDTNTVTNTAYSYITFDVTSYVQAELAASRSKVSFAMKSLTAHDPRVFWNSKEFGSNPPQLVVQTAAANRVASGSVLELEPQSVAKLKLSTYPNPFRGSSTITFHLDQSAHTNVSVFDVTGRRVAVLVNNRLSAGNHRVVFAPNGNTAGVYIMQLTIDGKTTTKKLVGE